jgi:hypothetical protein
MVPFLSDRSYYIRVVLENSTELMEGREPATREEGKGLAWTGEDEDFLGGASVFIEN